MLKKKAVTNSAAPIQSLCGRCRKPSPVLYDSAVEPPLRICNECLMLEGATDAINKKDAPTV